MKEGLGVSALRADRATEASPGANSTVVSAIRSVSHDASRTPFGDHCRQRDAIRDIRDRYWALRNKLAARMEREIERLGR